MRSYYKTRLFNAFLHHLLFLSSLLNPDPDIDYILQNEII
jgi:hypothetical protein